MASVADTALNHHSLTHSLTPTVLLEFLHYMYFLQFSSFLRSFIRDMYVKKVKLCVRTQIFAWERKYFAFERRYLRSNEKVCVRTKISGFEQKKNACERISTWIPHLTSTPPSPSHLDSMRRHSWAPLIRFPRHPNGNPWERNFLVHFVPSNPDTPVSESERII